MKKMMLLFTLIPLMAGCGEDGDNSLPWVMNPLDDIVLSSGFSSHTVDLAGVFSDADSDVLTFSVVTSDKTVVSAEIEERQMLKISEIGIGIATVTITANDSHRATVSDIVGIEVLDNGGEEEEPSLNQTSYQLGDIMWIEHGQKAILYDPVADQSYQITFIEFDEGRCHEDLCYVCFGSQAEIQLHIENIGKGQLSLNETVTLKIIGCVTNDHPCSGEEETAEINNLRICLLQLIPYPKGQDIKENEYKAKIKISKT